MHLDDEKIAETKNITALQIGPITLSTIMFNTGVPQGCILSPQLYMLSTSGLLVAQTPASNLQTLWGLIHDDQKAPYRVKVQCGQFCNISTTSICLSYKKKCNPNLIYVDRRQRSSRRNVDVKTDVRQSVYLTFGFELQQTNDNDFFSICIKRFLADFKTK